MRDNPYLRTNQMVIQFDFIDTRLASDLEWAIPACRREFESSTYCLVTCQDSARREQLWATDLAQIPSIERRSDGLLVRSDELLVVGSCEQYFTGFDELWLLPHRPNTDFPPDSGFTSEEPITSDRSAKNRESIGKWMRDVACILGLGDGCGLNIASPDPSILDMARKSAPQL